MFQSRCVLTIVFVLGMTIQSFAFEVGAIVREIDAEKRLAHVFANGQERTVKIDEAVKVLDRSGDELAGGLDATQLKAGETVTINVQRKADTMVIVEIRLGGKVEAPTQTNSPGKESVGKSSVGFIPLTEMTADDRYKGEAGGLYGDGKNEPPKSLRVAAQNATASIIPRDSLGQPTADGKIAFVSVSMSNATQEFSRFKQIADTDPQKSPHVSIVDCAQGGQTMARWADPEAACWSEADRRLAAAGISNQQVQVVWIKLANAAPSGELQEHGRALQRDTEKVLVNLRKRFANLQVAYLGSRIYGGYSDGRLNPEPYAYEGAFVVRWLIQDQESDGNDQSPLLLWGPYFWADGMTPRKSDGLIWQRSDLVSDGTHPSDTGRQKVAEQLLSFFKNDANARTWFVQH